MAHETLIGFEEATGRRELEERVEALEEDRVKLREEVANLKEMVMNVQGLVISGLRNGNGREPGSALSSYEAPQVGSETQDKSAKTKNNDASQPKGRPTRCTVVQSDPEHGYVLYALDAKGKPAVCCLRPNLWADVNHREGEETTVIVPYAAKWYRPIPIKGRFVRSGPRSIRFEYEGEEIWIYRAQVTIIIDGDGTDEFATSDALNRIQPGTEVALVISPYMAQKLGLIEKIKEREVKLV